MSRKKRKKQEKSEFPSTLIISYHWIIVWFTNMTEIGFWCVNQGVQFSREKKGRKKGTGDCKPTGPTQIQKICKH